MKKSIKTYVAIALCATFGLAIGCDIPEEKKSVFRSAATTQQLDSSKNLQEETEQEETKLENKKEQKKPHAFAKRDKVFI